MISYLFFLLLIVARYNSAYKHYLGGGFDFYNMQTSSVSAETNIGSGGSQTASCFLTTAAIGCLCLMTSLIRLRHTNCYSWNVKLSIPCSPRMYAFVWRRSRFSTSYIIFVYRRDLTADLFPWECTTAKYVVYCIPYSDCDKNSNDYRNETHNNNNNSNNSNGHHENNNDYYH